MRNSHVELETRRSLYALVNAISLPGPGWTMHYAARPFLTPNQLLLSLGRHGTGMEGIAPAPTGHPCR